MKIGLLKVIIISLFFFFLASPLQAANSLDVVINEIAWMGTETSYNDEWIELYNNTNSPINLAGWLIKAADGTPEISLAGTVLAKKFYLLERTDDDTVPGITADQIYTGALENNGENLELDDNFGNLIDKVNSSQGWLAGDNLTKQTMERKSSNSPGTVAANWQTSQNPGGTPKSENSPPDQIGEVGPRQTESQATEEMAEIIDYPSGIVINEILPSPTGADLEGEWIEILNQNNFEIDLSGWKISDKIGSVTVYTFPPETKISPFGFLVLTRPETKIVMNNSGDEISLFQPDGNLIESIVYEKAPRGQSYARQDDNWFWTISLTPGSLNVITKIEAGESDKTEPQKIEKTEISGYPPNILINEILPSPEGPDAQEEWIEILNQNNFEVDLSGWQIRDTTGKVKTYTFPKGTKVGSQGFLVLSRPETKITLNNDGDGLELLQPNGEVIDQISYQKAPQGQSYNQTDNEWAWSDNLTPGSPNIIPAQVEEEIEQETKKAAEIPEKGLAAIGQQFPKPSRPLFVLLISSAIAIFSGIIILVLRKKVKTE